MKFKLLQPALICFTLFLSPQLHAIEKQFKTQLSSNALGTMCLSTMTDSPQAGANIQLASCDTNRSRWDVIPLQGDKYKIVSKATGLCLAVANDSSTSANLVQQTCNTSDTRLWKFNLVSEISLGSTYPTLREGIYSYVSINGVKNEIDGGIYELKNAAAFLCADLSSGSQTSGTQIVQYGCSRGFNQHWYINKGVPDAAEKFDFNLLVVNKSVSTIPGKEKTGTAASIRKQRYWAETVLPKFFHDYTSGRVKLNIHYYESPYPLTQINSNETVSPNLMPEDSDIIVNPGWYDGVLINHFTSNLTSSGLVTYNFGEGNFNIGVSNTPLGDNTTWFNGNEIAQLGGMVHELMHQFEYYFTLNPNRNKNVTTCAPEASMLDCGSDQPAAGAYVDITDGLGNNLAFYRDFLNGYMWGGTAGIGDPMWNLNFKLRERSSHFIPGGPLNAFENKSTCLDLTNGSGVGIRDLYKNNNFGHVNNANQNDNWITGNSFSFDGVDDYLKISNLVGDNFTISAWIKSSQIFPSASASTKGIGLVYAGVENGDGFELRGIRNASGADVLSLTLGTFTAIVSNVDITTNTWTHIAAVRNVTTGIATLYVNGIQVASGNAGTNRLSKNPIIKIGSAFPYSSTINDHFKGEMADFCVINNALDATTITQLAKNRNTFDKLQGPQTYVSDTSAYNVTNGWGTLGINKSVSGGTLSIGGKTYTKGLGAHAPSSVSYKLNRQAIAFKADIGIDDVATQHVSSAQFMVYGDGNLLYSSQIKLDTDLAESINVNVTGVDELKLVTTAGPNNDATADHTNWANARIVIPPSKFLSDRAFVTATTTNGWQAIGIDKSNEGRALTINGKIYTKGLGAHAPSKIVYLLNGKANRFLSDIGIDDEVNFAASATFEVYGDGNLLYRSKDKLSTDAPESISVDVNGVNELVLVTNNGKNNDATGDHTNWANARVVEPPITYLSDMTWFSGTTGYGNIEKDLSVSGSSITINGKVYAKGLGTHSPSTVVYKLNRQSSRFLSDIGIDDVAAINVSSAEFQVYGDGILLYRSGDKIDTDAPESIDIDVSNVDELKLVTTVGKNNNATADHTDWANARLIKLEPTN